MPIKHASTSPRKIGRGMYVPPESVAPSDSMQNHCLPGSLAQHLVVLDSQRMTLPPAARNMVRMYSYILRGNSKFLKYTAHIGCIIAHCVRIRIKIQCMLLTTTAGVTKISTLWLTGPEIVSRVTVKRRIVSSPQANLNKDDKILSKLNKLICVFSSFIYCS